MSRSSGRRLVPLALLTGLLSLACVAETPASDGICEPPVLRASLPAPLKETSGIAVSRRHTGVFWTHNDSGNDSTIFAIDSTGAILGTVRVRRATNRDWEDIAVGPCGSGEDDCLFIGDIGDNNERHRRIVVYRIPEPDPRADSVSAPAERIQAVYPDGPRDAEALYVTRQGIHIIPKGRRHAIELFRLAPPYRTGRDNPLQAVQTLALPPTSASAHVTAAAATADGGTIAIRTYAAVRFYEPDADSLRALGPATPMPVPGMLKGEGIDFLPDGRLVLSGERSAGNPPTLALVRCTPRTEPRTDAEPDV